MSEMSADPGRENELYVVDFGEEACAPLHAYGPAQRTNVLIHFVASGCGVFHCGGRQYPVHAGQGFVIFPEEETFYQADGNAPWHYAWVGFCGREAQSLTRSAGLDAFRRVCTAEDPQAAWQALCQLRQEAGALRLRQMAAIGNLLRFLSLIAPAQDPYAPADPASQYCEKALWYMEARFDRDISIQETAAFAGLSRAHLYRVMMAEYGCPPKEMLLRIRMRHARRMLLETSLTLDEIAHRIGLSTGAQLGAAFRSVYGTTPGRFRREKRPGSDSAGQ